MATGSRLSSITPATRTARRTKSRARSGSSPSAISGQGKNSPTITTYSMAKRTIRQRAIASRAIAVDRYIRRTSCANGNAKRKRRRQKKKRHKRRFIPFQIARILRSRSLPEGLHCVFLGIVNIENGQQLGHLQ